LAVLSICARTLSTSKVVVDFLAGFITMLSGYMYIDCRFGLERDLFRIDNFYLERERGLRCFRKCEGESRRNHKERWSIRWCSEDVVEVEGDRCQWRKKIFFFWSSI